MRKKVPYYVSAILINCFWFTSLLFFHHKFFLGTLVLSHLELFVLFQTAGLTTAILFKRQITEASNRKSIFLGLILPFFALYVFIIPMLIYKAIFGRLGGGDVASALFYGPFFLVQFFYLTAPLGLLSQFTLRMVARNSRDTRLNSLR